MDVSFAAVTAGLGALFAVALPTITIIRFVSSWRKDITAHAEDHAKIVSRLEHVEKDVTGAHDKIRTLETLRSEDHDLIVQINEAIKYIKKTLDELKESQK
jgi:wobble nucleotide-excising tRNase